MKWSRKIIRKGWQIDWGLDDDHVFWMIQNDFDSLTWSKWMYMFFFERFWWNFIGFHLHCICFWQVFCLISRWKFPCWFYRVIRESTATHPIMTYWDWWPGTSNSDCKWLRAHLCRHANGRALFGGNPFLRGKDEIMDWDFSWWRFLWCCCFVGGRGRLCLYISIYAHN